MNMRFARAWGDGAIADPWEIRLQRALGRRAVLRGPAHNRSTPFRMAGPRRLSCRVVAQVSKGACVTCKPCSSAWGFVLALAVTSHVWTVGIRVVGTTLSAQAAPSRGWWRAHAANVNAPQPDGCGEKQKSEWEEDDR
jgi:hypothetical protein